MKIIINNVYSKLIFGGVDNLLDFNLQQTLREYLRVRVEKYYTTEAFKEGKWDGYKYYITPTGRIETGFLPTLSKFLTELNVTVEVEDLRKDLPRLTEINSNIGNIDGVQWVGRDYQIDMVRKLNNYELIGGKKYYFPRGIYDCATNAGKNSISAMIVKSLEKKYTTLFVVNSIDIYKQAVEFFSQALGEEVGEINSSKYEPKWFTVAMYKSTLSKAKQSMNVKVFLGSVEVLLVDESDEAGAKEYSTLMSIIGAGMRVFVSGTPLESSKVNNMNSVGMSGKVLGTITNQFLVENKYSQKPIINILLNNLGRNPFLFNYKIEVREGIFLSAQRAQLIVDALKLRKDKSVLITFNEGEHGEFMYNYIKERINDVTIDIVSGKDKKRAEKLSKFKAGETKWLLASMIIKRGLNIPIIRTIIMAQGGKSTTVLKQIIGRGTRTDGIHEDMEILDFYDTGKYLQKHSKSRIKIYENEGFEINYSYPNRLGRPIL